MTPARAAEHDAIVVGAGVAGLWCAWALRRAGLGVAVLERSALGDGQTIWSQGILHAGVKYRLPGASLDASTALAAQRERWAAALAGGSGDAPDLGAVRVLSPCTWLWTTEGLGSRAAAIGATAAMRSAVREAAGDDRPIAFAGAPSGVRVYRADEPVIEPASLLAALRDALAPGTVRSGVVRGAEAGRLGARLTLDDGGSIGAACVVLAAGCGNEALLRMLGVREPVTQRRPLHMVLARGGILAPGGVLASAQLPELHGHCLGASSVPRLTITTAGPPDDRVWTIGGALAEDGVARDAPAQLAEARRQLSACLPWLDLASVRMRAGRVDRCEARTADGSRPDGPVVRQWGPVIGVWPTKLALAPAAADEVVRLMAGPHGPGARARPDTAREPRAGAGETPVPVARRPWEGDEPWR